MNATVLSERLPATELHLAPMYASFLELLFLNNFVLEKKFDVGKPCLGMQKFLFLVGHAFW